jgi:hypothetical protein
MRRRTASRSPMAGPPRISRWSHDMRFAKAVAEEDAPGLHGCNKGDVAQNEARRGCKQRARGCAKLIGASS